MLISHYSPNDFMTRFEKHLPEHTFLKNHCTEDVDLIYCGSVSQLGKALVAKKKFKKPLICWVWDIPYNWRTWCRTDEELKAHKWRDDYIRNCIINLSKCDKIISASKWTLRVLWEEFGLVSKQMYFYIDTEELDAVPEQENKGYVIQISRFAINKRFDLTIRAMEGMDRKLILIGTGDGAPLVKLANELGVDASVYVDLPAFEKIRFLKQSELLVSPSVFEGWGMTPIEALHCNKAVLLSDLEVFREVYGDNADYHRMDSIEDMNRMIYSRLYGPIFRGIVHICKPLISSFTIPKFSDRWGRMVEGFVG